jgi:hypothetical protein
MQLGCLRRLIVLAAARFGAAGLSEQMMNKC